MSTILREMRHALRSLASRPAYPLVVVLTLGLAIGANTATFSVAKQNDAKGLKASSD